MNGYFSLTDKLSNSGFFYAGVNSEGADGTNIGVQIDSKNNNYYLGNPNNGDVINTKTTPTISNGAGVPSSTPFKLGDMYIDTNGLKIYIATGTSSSADWTIIN